MDSSMMLSVAAALPLRRCSLGTVSYVNGGSVFSPFGHSYSHLGMNGANKVCCPPNKYWIESGPHSRAEPSSLELEAISAVQQLSLAVRTISVSEMLPRTAELIFVNVETVEGQPYCLELTSKGWRVTSLRSDCMQGDFTRMDLFTHYFQSIYDMMHHISPGYKQALNENLAEKLRLLEANEAEEDEYAEEPICEVLSPLHSRQERVNGSNGDALRSSAN